MAEEKKTEAPYLPSPGQEGTKERGGGSSDDDGTPGWAQTEVHERDTGWEKPDVKMEIWILE